MKLIWKIIIILLIILGILLVIAVTTPSATDINNLNCPTDWENRGDVNYVNSIKGGHILVSEKNNATLNEFKTNNTTDNYVVKDISHNNTMYEYTYENDYGVFEVVRVNGTEYMLTYSCSFNDLDSFGPDELWGSDVLKEFNKLNNLEPLPV